ncbi:MAG TPA: lysophospholipid acyltransferase family protein [Steroidobacteraceae bacterium]|nr:lysophospholipid acyltransferase family protein [Steroidobacteraceae bacterium]
MQRVPDEQSPPSVGTPLPLALRALSRLPWPVLYGATACLAFLAHRVLRYRLEVVRDNVRGSFPDLDARARRHIVRGYYRRLGQLAAEVVKSATLAPHELEERVALRNIECLRGEVEAGRSVLVVAAHQCNWEWMLLTMSLKLRFPVAAAYKPLHSTRAERWMRLLRTRFGGSVIPAKELLGQLIRRRAPQAVAMVADQEPVTSDFKWWTRFLGRPTAFYMGPEKIAQATRIAVVFAAVRRISRGRYEVTFELLAPARAALEPGEITERYARLVEAQILASPEDWTWSHRRWKLKRPLYGAGASALDAGSV